MIYVAMIGGVLIGWALACWWFAAQAADEMDAWAKEQRALARAQALERFNGEGGIYDYMNERDLP